MSIQPGKTLASLGTANRIARAPETHPLTWRLRDDGQPVWAREMTPGRNLRSQSRFFYRIAGTLFSNFCKGPI